MGLGDDAAKRKTITRKTEEWRFHAHRIADRHCNPFGGIAGHGHPDRLHRPKKQIQQ